MSDSPVLVTGGSGFIGGHVVLELLARGHRVRATTRSLAREAEVRAGLGAAATSAGDALEFVAADLTRDTGWDRALAGVGGVVHVASPVMPGQVEDEDLVIVPAREGTLRVLRAARTAGVARVVLTSAFHAVAWGHPWDEHVFTEADWTRPDGPGADAYARAKTFAEQAAWDFVGQDPRGPELTTLLPVAVTGPVLGSQVSGANQIIRRLITGQVPGLVDTYIPIVDVRDVAAAHVEALFRPEAAGLRLLLAADPAMSMAQIAAVLTDGLGAQARQVPTRTIPDEVVREQAATNPAMRAVADGLGHARRFSTERARRVLDWAPRPSEQAVLAAGRSLLAAGSPQE